MLPAKKTIPRHRIHNIFFIISPFLYGLKNKWPRRDPRPVLWLNPDERLSRGVNGLKHKSRYMGITVNGHSRIHRKFYIKIK
jgi:hypothetical protein